MQKKSTIRRLTRDKAFPLLIILIVLLIASMILSSGVLKGAPLSAMFTKGFMAQQNLLANFYKLVIQMFMMIGLGCILISGNIDLSIAAQATLGGLIFAKLCQGTMPWGVALLITLLIAVCFGLINTLLVNFFKFPAFIATIGASSIYGGLCNVFTGGNNIQIARQSFLALGSAKVLGVFPVIFLISVLFLIVFQFVLSKTRFGRSLFMAGGNPIAARLSGLNPDKLRMILFIINSVMSVLGGILWSAQVKLASPTSIIADAPNMTAISAAILGGIAFTGGAGNLIGPFIALVLINAFESMLNVLQINAYYVVLAQGVLLLVALIIDYVSAERRRKAMIAAAAGA